MSTAQAIEANNQYIDFWNSILAPKFNAWRHILAGGLHRHSAEVFPALPLHSGDNALDVFLYELGQRVHVMQVAACFG